MGSSVQQLVGMVESFNALEDVSRTDRVPVHSLSLQSLARLWLEIAATDGHLLCNEHYTLEELVGVAYAEWNRQTGAEISEAIKKLFPEGQGRTALVRAAIEGKMGSGLVQEANVLLSFTGRVESRTTKKLIVDFRKAILPTAQSLPAIIAPASKKPLHHAYSGNTSSGYHGRMKTTLPFVDQSDRDLHAWKGMTKTGKPKDVKFAAFCHVIGFWLGFKMRNAALSAGDLLQEIDDMDLLNKDIEHLTIGYLGSASAYGWWNLDACYRYENVSRGQCLIARMRATSVPQDSMDLWSYAVAGKLEGTMVERRESLLRSVLETEMDAASEVLELSQPYQGEGEDPKAIPRSRLEESRAICSWVHGGPEKACQWWKPEWGSIPTRIRYVSKVSMISLMTYVGQRPRRRARIDTEETVE